MDGRKVRNSNMLIPAIVMGALAAVLLFVAYQRGEGEHIEGLRRSLSMLVGIIPLLVFAFIVAGLVQVLIPREILAQKLGAESGMKGILIGTVAGGLTPGGPYVNLPVAVALWKGGAGVGTMVAFLTGWSLWAVSRLPLEVGILGWKLTAIRLCCTFFFPPIAGLIAQTLFPTVR